MYPAICCPFREQGDEFFVGFKISREFAMESFHQFVACSFDLISAHISQVFSSKHYAAVVSLWSLTSMGYGFSYNGILI
jgi:hypothetical protein